MPLARLSVFDRNGQKQALTLRQLLNWPEAAIAARKLSAKERSDSLLLI
ncbi:hypothetical protein [Dongia sp.]